YGSCAAPAPVTSAGERPRHVPRRRRGPAGERPVAPRPAQRERVLPEEAGSAGVLERDRSVLERPVPRRGDVGTEVQVLRLRLPERDAADADRVDEAVLLADS